MEKKKMDKKAIKEAVLTHIRAGNDYSTTKKLLEKEEIVYPGLKTSFYKWKQEIFPEQARHNALQTLADKREVKESKPSKLPAWNSKKQKEADESVFANVLNEALFYFIPCPQKGMTIEDVRQINLGGGIVGVVTYYTDINLNHPIVILVTRVIMMVIKVRNICYKIQEKYSELKEKAKTALPGQGSIGSMQK